MRKLSETISQGTTTMLAFPELKPDEVAALVRYLKTADPPAPAPVEPAARPPAVKSKKI